MTHDLAETSRCIVEVHLTDMFGTITLLDCRLHWLGPWSNILSRRDFLLSHPVQTVEGLNQENHQVSQLLLGKPVVGEILAPDQVVVAA